MVQANSGRAEEEEPDTEDDEEDNPSKCQVSCNLSVWIYKVGFL